jgi:hypothetical protein
VLHGIPAVCQTGTATQGPRLIDVPHNNPAADGYSGMEKLEGMCNDHQLYDDEQLC